MKAKKTKKVKKGLIVALILLLLVLVVLILGFLQQIKQPIDNVNQENISLDDSNLTINTSENITEQIPEEIIEEVEESRSPISEGEAREIALEEVPGVVTDVSVEKYLDWVTYVIEIDAYDGPQTDVYVDIYTGKILEIDT